MYYEAGHQSERMKTKSIIIIVLSFALLLVTVRYFVSDFTHPDMNSNIPTEKPTPKRPKPVSALNYSEGDLEKQQKNKVILVHERTGRVAWYKTFTLAKDQSADEVVRETIRSETRHMTEVDIISLGVQEKAKDGIRPSSRTYQGYENNEERKVEVAVEMAVREKDNLAVLALFREKSGSRNYGPMLVSIMETQETA